MKSRIVALALAAVMTLGSCMSASAKEVFTKGLIGGAVVKNGAYVESVQVIDIDIWNKANSASLWTSYINNITSTQANTLAGKTLDTTKANLANGDKLYLNNALTTVTRSLTTDQQALLLTIIENYGWEVAATQASVLTATAPYEATWSYDQWVSRMQIAPYAERYIVAMNYENLYKQLKGFMEKAVAQGQITVSDAYANGSDYATAKKALNILDAKFTAGTTFSGASIQVGSFPTTTIPAGATTVTPTGSAVAYTIYPVIYGIPQVNTVTNTDKISTAVQYVAVPATTTTSAAFNVRKLDTTTGKITVVTVKAGTDATVAAVAGLGMSPIQVLASYINITADAYKKDVDNALSIAETMRKQFADAESYYKGQKNEGLAYLINNVRKDLGGKVTADNIDKAIGFEVDPYDNLKWDLNEKKEIAFTSPSISDFTTGKSLVVLHFNTTACSWEAIDCKYVEYNGVKGIEGTFSSCSPVIVVTLKNFNDAGAAAAAKATDAKKSPATGENF